MSLNVNIMIFTIMGCHYSCGWFLLLLLWCTIMYYMSSYVSIMAVIILDYHYHCYCYLSPLSLLWCANLHFMIHMPILWLLSLQITVITIGLLVLLSWCTMMYHMSPCVNIMTVILAVCHYYYLLFTTVTMRCHYASYDITCQQHGCYHYISPLLVIIW